MVEKIKNPLTGRQIDKDGPTHKKLIKDGIVDSDGNEIKKKSSKKVSVEKSKKKSSEEIVAKKVSVEKEIKKSVEAAVEDSAEDILRKTGIVTGTKKTVPEIKAFAETHKIIVSKKLKADIIEEIREKFIKSLETKATKEVKKTLPKQPSKRDVKDTVEEVVEEVIEEVVEKVEKKEKKEKKHKKEKKEKVEKPKKEKKHKHKKDKKEKVEEPKCYGKNKVKCGDDYICTVDGKCVSKKDHQWEYKYVLKTDDDEIYAENKSDLEKFQEVMGGGGSITKVEVSAFESSTKKSSTKKSVSKETSIDRSKYTAAELKVVDIFEECIKGL